MISDEEEVESFEITDYDLESELNPGLRKRQTKEQAIYGIWATSDDETEGTHQRGSKIRKSTYAEPMGFVSGGLFKQKEKPGKGAVISMMYMIRAKSFHPMFAFDQQETLRKNRPMSCELKYKTNSEQ